MVQTNGCIAFASARESRTMKDTISASAQRFQQLATVLRTHNIFLRVRISDIVVGILALLQALNLAVTATDLMQSQCFLFQPMPVHICASGSHHVVDPWLGVNAWVVSVGLWSLALAIWLLRLAPRSGAAVIFCLESLTISAALDFAVVPRNNIAIDIAFVILAAAISVLYFLSHMRLLDAPLEVSWRKSVGGYLGAWFIVCINTGLALLAISPWGELGQWLWLAPPTALLKPGVNAEPVGLTFLATYVTFASSVLVTLALTARGYQRIRMPSVRRRLRIFFLGSAAAVLPVALLSMAPRAMTDGILYVPFSLTVLPLILYPCAYLYAQFVGRLAQYDVRVRSFAASYFTAILLLAVYVFSLVAIGPILGVGVYASNILLPGAIATTITVLVVQPIGKAIRHLTRRVWADETTEPLKLAKDLAAHLAQTVDLDTLGISLTTQLVSGLCLTGAAFLQVEEGDIMNASGSGALQWVSSGRLHLGDPIRTILIASSVSHNPLLPTQHLSIDWSEMRNSFAGDTDWVVDPAFLLPLVLNSELLGVLLLGPRQPDVRSGYTEEEIDCLCSVADYAATALRTIRLLEDRERYGDEMTESLDRERERIGETLHTGPISALSEVGRSLDNLLDKTNAAGSRKELADARWDVTKIIADLRAIMYSVESPGLVSFAPAVMIALDATEQDWRGQSPELRRIIAQDVPDIDVPPKVRTCLVEIVREAVANARKHAQATTISVTITTQVIPDSVIRGLVLDIEDDGKGFAFAGLADFARDHHHTGLYRMRRRAEMAGATLSYLPRADHGTHVHVEWPRRSK